MGSGFESGAIDLSRPANTLCVPRVLANSPAWGRLARALLDRMSDAGLRRSETLVVLADRRPESIAEAWSIFGVRIEPLVDGGWSDQPGRSVGRGRLEDPSIVGWLEDREHAIPRLRRRDAGRVRGVFGVAAIAIHRGASHVVSLSNLLDADEILSSQIAENRERVARAANRASRKKKEKKEKIDEFGK